MSKPLSRVTVSPPPLGRFVFTWVWTGCVTPLPSESGRNHTVRLAGQTPPRLSWRNFLVVCEAQEGLVGASWSPPPFNRRVTATLPLQGVCAGAGHSSLVRGLWSCTPGSAPKKPRWHLDMLWTTGSRTSGLSLLP